MIRGDRYNNPASYLAAIFDGVGGNTRWEQDIGAHDSAQDESNNCDVCGSLGKAAGTLAARADR